MARRLTAAALTLASGTTMMLAGYVAQTESWALAVTLTIPGGLLILAAIALAGAPGTVGRQLREGPPPGYALVAALTLLSGATMMLAGYAGGAWSWGLAFALATLGGVVILAALRAAPGSPPRSRG